MADDTGVSVREFRANLAQYLERANKGEVITITRGGRLDAQLGPVDVEATDGDG
jgi:prevent-host-death family protein